MESLYVHLPFCRKKCAYCDFVSFPASFQEKEAYLSLLAEEAALHAGRSPAGLATLYFGGGTPSLLSLSQWEKLLAAIDAVFGIRSGAEISLEANPADLGAAYGRGLRSLGFNRISIGGQAFQDRHLQAMGRDHDAAMLERAVANAAVHFDNLSLDLIYGLPGQTLAEWEESLEKTVALPLRHISTYGLKLEGEAAWSRAYAAGRLALPLPNEEENSAMQVFALEYLAAAGFPHYEIANFARPGFACRHNLAYWLGEDYLGLGLNASSYLDGRRRRNAADMPSYRAMLAAKKAPVAEEEILGEEERLLEEFYLRLRLAAGVNLVEMKKKYHLDFFVAKKGQMVKLLESGLIRVENGQLSLTIAGIPLHNEILLRLI